MQTHSARYAYFILSLTAFFLAANHVIGRSVEGDVPPIGLSFWRWLTGCAILLPFVLPRIGQTWPVFKRHIKLLALLGFFMIGSTTLVLVALNFTYAINVSLINAVQPTLTVLFAAIFFREALRPSRVIGVIAGIGGVVMMVSRGDWQVLQQLDFALGDFITVVAMCGFSAYALCLRYLPAELNVVEALFGITVTGTVMLLPVYLLESVTQQAMPLTWQSSAAVLALALLVSVFGNLMWNTGNRIIGPSRASMFINLIPVFGAVLAIIFLGEHLYSYHVVGGVLVCLGIFLAAGEQKVQR